MSPMDALHPTNWLSELKDGNNNLDCVWTPALNVHRVSRERKTAVCTSIIPQVLCTACGTTHGCKFYL